jgi:hypothetical protein
MHPQEVRDALEGIANSAHFAYDVATLVDRWEAAGVGLEVVEPILRFMEAHPGVDFGVPGPLVHLVETFHGYEDQLVTSVSRKPIAHTVWMLNRVLNDTDDPSDRCRLIALMKTVETHPEADTATRERARHYAARVGQ